MSNKRLSIVVVGSGNVAEALAVRLGASEGVTLQQIYARNAERGSHIAHLAGTTWSAEALATADVYLIAVSDRAVEDVAIRLPFPPEALVAHTAGSIPLAAIPERVGGRGVFYPLQSFSVGRSEAMEGAPIFIEGDTEATCDRLRDLAVRMGLEAHTADTERRRRLHLAGVFVNNFVNHLYATATDIVTREGLDFEVLKPIIRETAAKAIATANPHSVQTGPARRGDRAVIEHHMAMLKDDDTKREIYNYLTQSIWETSKKM
ncbi:MAG: DUF2520 domain-containing protein [Alistipes sp.]|nr:DUF2520 domain-containing protein [Alistipes sp.]